MLFKNEAEREFKVSPVTSPQMDALIIRGCDDEISRGKYIHTAAIRLENRRAMRQPHLYPLT